MRHSRRGFTLIEIVIVIGIIMLLIGLLVVGFRHINATAAKKETIAELKTCRALLTEYENHVSLKGIESFDPQQNDSNAPSSPKLIPVFHDPFPSITPTANTGWPSLAIGDVTGDMGDHSSTPRYGDNAINLTRNVMYVLSHLPANRTEFQNLPTKRILEAQGGSPSGITGGAIILDGWSNPIIFVPRGGMHVNITTSGTSQTYVVRSNGTTLVTGADPPLTGSERPFFASAGQDGDFTKGEDNVYSFQE